MDGTATRPVIAGMDGTQESLAALQWAAKEAVRRDTRLVLFHACQFEGPESRHPELPEDSELLLEHVYRWNRHAAELARGIAPGVEVELRIRLGFAPDLLLAESLTAALIVLGAHGLGGLRGALIGSVALTVAAKADCPVVVVRGRSRMRGPVVVGVDGSASSEQALRFALDAAVARGAPLDVLHAWHEAAFLRFGTRFLARATAERRALEEQVAGWARKYPDLEITTDAVQDHKPSHALMRAVSGAQLIVIGSRGRGAVSGGLLGSTGNDLLAHATCPVAIVH